MLDADGRWVAVKQRFKRLKRLEPVSKPPKIALGDIENGVFWRF
jgi:hypothetical protein